MFKESFDNDSLVTNGLVLNAHRIFHYAGSTLLTEESFQNQEDSTRQTKNKKMSGATLWRNPTRRGLLSEKFNFNEVSTAGIDDTQAAQVYLLLYGMFA